MISRLHCFLLAMLFSCLLILAPDDAFAQRSAQATPSAIQGSQTPIEDHASPIARPASTPPTVHAKKILPPSEIIVGVVGSRVLTKEQLDRKVDKILPKERSRDEETYLDDRRSIESKLLYDWADIALLAVEAEAQGITISDEELVAGIEKLKQSAERAVDVDAALQQAGVLKMEFLQEMRDAFLGDKLIRKEVERTYPEDKLRALYEQRRLFFIHPAQVRASHLFKGFRTKNPTREEKQQLREQIERLRKRALSGEDFQGLAKESDAFSRANAGDLGWLEAKTFLPPPVSDAVFHLKVGEVSKVIESEFGYHVVKVTDMRPPRGTTFESARDEVIATFYDDVRTTLLQSLRSKHSVILNAGGIPEHLLGKSAQPK